MTTYIDFLGRSHEHLNLCKNEGVRVQRPLMIMYYFVLLTTVFFISKTYMLGCSMSPICSVDIFLFKL